MTAATLTLTDFLLARIAEDEAVARRAGDVRALKGSFGTGSWIEFPDGSTFDFTDRQLADMPAAHLAALDNAARFRPSRVLAECEAKRRIVRAYQSADASSGVDYELGFGLDLAVRVIAAVYSDHPEYRDEWRP